MKAKINKNQNICCSIGNKNNIKSSITTNDTIDSKIEGQEDICAGSTQRGPQGLQGLPGIGIDRIEPISQNGYDITYRMYFTDASYYDYVVSNGTGSLKWIEISSDDWIQVSDDKYRYTYNGSYGVIELFSGNISSKSKIEYDTTIEGNITYLYSLEPINGYALVAGVEGANSVYIYEQAIPSDTWVINHNLNTKPSITVVDSAGDTVVGSEAYNDDNTVTITFASAFSGSAYLNYTR